MVSEISILIPVYDQNVLPLVEALHLQASSLTVPYEIRVYDDGSKAEIKKQNQPLATVSGVVYRELLTNLGRTRIRKLLAQEAKFNWLLFLDNDVLPSHPNFLENYLVNTNQKVAVGGVAYQVTFPAGAQLRWKYGKEREQTPAHVRQQNPYERVFFSNLLVEKSIFLEMMQENQVTGYGHEDTLFAHTLQAHQIKVQHLDNLVFHLGLESAAVFLDKTEQAVQNLVYLQKDTGIGQSSKLYKAYQTLQKLRIDGLLKKQAHWLLPWLRKKLSSQNPSLRLFDLYKLVLYARYNS